MKVKLSTSNTGTCPEGVWRGKLVKVNEPKQRIKRACPTQFQFTFLVETPDGPRWPYEKFCVDTGWNGELTDFLETWLTDKLKGYLDEEQEIDFNDLLGEEADLVIQHHQEKGYNQPFVKIVGAFPPGTPLNEE